MIINTGFTLVSAVAGSLLLGSVKKGSIIVLPTFFSSMATFELSNRMIAQGSDVKEVYIIHAGVSLFLYSLIGPLSIRLMGLNYAEFNRLVMLASIFCLFIAIHTYVYARFRYDFEQKVKELRSEIISLSKRIHDVKTIWTIEKDFYRSHLSRLDGSLEGLKILKPHELEKEIKENMQILKYLKQWITQHERPIGRVCKP